MRTAQWGVVYLLTWGFDVTRLPKWVTRLPSRTVSWEQVDGGLVAGGGCF